MKKPKVYLAKQKEVWYAYYSDADGKYTGKSLRTKNEREAKRKQKELIEVLENELHQEQLWEMYQHLTLHHPELLVQPDPSEFVDPQFMSREELLAFITGPKVAVPIQADWHPPLDLGKGKRVSRTEPATNLPVAEFWTLFLEANADRVSKSTVKNFETAWKNFDSLIHPTTVSNITPESVRRFVGLRREKDIKETTIDLDIRMLQLMFKWAIEEGYHTGPNPVVESRKTFKIKREAKKEIRALSEEQLIKCLELAKAINTDTYLAFAIAAYSGCRITEVGSLRWEDSVDLDAGTLTIKPRKSADGISESGTKTESSQRTVPLFPELKSILAEYKQDSGYIVFPDKTDRYPFKLPWPVQKVRDGLDLKWFSFHVLRHTFVSLLLNKGLEMPVVSKLVGHSNFQITFNTYFHLDPKSLQGISLTNGGTSK